MEQNENLPVPQPEEKGGLVKATRDFFGNALSTVKGKDLSAMVEEFSSEMTLVAEGLSEDQARLHELYQSLSAQQTVDKNEAREDVSRVSDALKETADRVVKAETLIVSLQKDIDRLGADLLRQKDSLDQYVKKAEEKKPRKLDNMAGLIRQLTILVGVGGGAWIIVTILNLLK